MDKVDKFAGKFEALNQQMNKAGLSDAEMINLTGLSVIDAIDNTGDPDKFHDDIICMLQALLN